jgi:cystathionine gamma-synthase
MTPEARAKAGISDGLLRLSVGIEACEDLVADLQAGLLRAARALADSRSEALRKTVDA